MLKLMILCKEEMSCLLCLKGTDAEGVCCEKPVKVGVDGFSAFRAPILAQSLDSIGGNATTQVTQWML
jgi:hypothetical protein